MGEKERAGLGIIKFTAIVALDALDGGAELGVNKSEEIGKGGKNLGFEAERKRPNVVGAIIKNYRIIFIARHTNNWGGP